MKKHLFKTEKSLWQEFVEYLASIYWSGAENDLEEQTLNYEYQIFKEIMASWWALFFARYFFSTPKNPVPSPLIFIFYFFPYFFAGYLSSFWINCFLPLGPFFHIGHITRQLHYFSFSNFGLSRSYLHRFPPPIFFRHDVK